MVRAFKQSPLAAQLWSLLVTPTAIVLALYGFFAHQNRERILLDAATGELANYTSLVRAALAHGGNRTGPEAMRTQMEALARADRVLGLAVFDQAGRPLGVTAELRSVSGELAEIARSALRSRRDVVVSRRLEGRPTLVGAVAMDTQGPRDPYALVIVLDLGHISALSASLDRGLVLTGAIVIVSIALLALWTSRRMVGDPVGAIVDGVARIAAGELGACVPAGGAREIALLGSAFNEMSARLADARAEAESQAEQRASVERRLRHSQALAAAGQIAASVAHEIGSPLNVILGRARRGAQHPQCSEPIRKELDAIASQSERITRVLSGLLTLARPVREAESRSTALDVVDEVVGFVGPEARRRGVTVGVEGREHATDLAIDRDALFQVVFNLIMNAIQAQSEGEVVIRFRGRAFDAARAVIEVEDCGPGVPREQASRIFDAFYTTKQGGTGLGLAIVAGILREAGGAIELVDRDAPGAIFRIFVPLPGGTSREERPGG